jgi:hypothetical protein
MTVKDLAQLIARRVMARAQEEPDPVLYFNRALARLTVLGQFPVENAEAELIRFGHEFGLLAQELDEVN